MKIKYLSASVLPSAAANSVHVMHMCEGLRQLGHDVTLVGAVPTEGADAHSLEQIFDYYGVEDRFAIARVNRSRMKYVGLLLYSLKGYLRCVRGSAAQLVYCRDYLGALFSAKGGFRTVFELHEMPSSFFSRICFNVLIGSACLERVVVISEVLRADVLTVYPQLVHKIVVAHDAARVTTGNGLAASVVKNERLQVGYTGGLYKGKGVELVAALARAMPHLDFHVVGGTGALLEQWRASTEDLGNLVFHGHVARSQVPARIASLDVVLLPNQRVVYGHAARADIGRWTSPLKMFEYMAAERAIVCSDLPVLKEVMNDDINCLLCDPESVDGWVDALNRLDADAALRQRLARRAKEDFVQHYTWTKRAEKIIACLES